MPRWVVGWSLRDIADIQNASKFGVGIQLESMAMSQEEMIEAGMIAPM